MFSWGSQNANEIKSRAMDVLVKREINKFITLSQDYSGAS